MCVIGVVGLLLACSILWFTKVCGLLLVGSGWWSVVLNSFERLKRHLISAECDVFRRVTMGTLHPLSFKIWLVQCD